MEEKDVRIRELEECARKLVTRDAKSSKTLNLQT